MQESGKNDFILKKAYEIAYAIFMVAAKISEPVLACELRDSAASMLGSSVRQEYDAALKNLSVLEYFVRFSMDVNSMGIKNAEIILGEIAGLEAEMANMAEPAKNPSSMDEVDVARIFSKSEPAKANNEISEESFKPSENGNSANRQTAILERIRQTGNCRIKDIQEILPESSERTIRYDLQALLEKNLIDRVGVGGPAVYYRLRQERQGITG